jgi:hypothetical protein
MTISGRQAHAKVSPTPVSHSSRSDKEVAKVHPPSVGLP